MGGITNDSSRILAVDRAFLGPESPTQQVYTDEAKTQQIMIKKAPVDRHSRLSFSLLPSGGFAVEVIENKSTVIKH